MTVICNEIFVTNRGVVDLTHYVNFYLLLWLLWPFDKCEWSLGRLGCLTALNAGFTISNMVLNLFVDARPTKLTVLLCFNDSHVWPLLIGCCRLLY